MIRRLIPGLKSGLRRGFASEASPAAQAAKTPALDTLPGAAKLPEFVLATVRQFPSLEPSRLQPVTSQMLGTQVPKDLLWRAVVFEADRQRVGASNPPGREQMGYSTAKLHKQKGVGKARVGDAGSPTRTQGGFAMDRNAPNKMATGLPVQVYAAAIRAALTAQYQEGRLFVIDGECELPESVKDNTTFGRQWLQGELGFKEKEMTVFFVNKERPILDSVLGKENLKADIVPKEFIEVRDILKARNVVIEYSVLKWLAAKYPNRDLFGTYKPWTH